MSFQVDFYLWGFIVVASDEVQKQELIISPPDEKGDYEGWQQFLSTMSQIFNEYGDIPIIHFSSHEKTWVNNYIKRYGDTDKVGQSVLKNLWDLYRTLTSCVILPVPSYGLKQLESFVGFKRTQEEYGGSWSIVRYNQYLQAPTSEEAERILDEIRLYNREDLLATYSVYKWLEEIVSESA